MATSMHRLQISLPHWQVQFLNERARRDGISIAEVIRQIVQHESEAVLRQSSVDSIWDIGGIVTDEKPLIDNVPVSHDPELYLAEPVASYKTTRRPRTRSRR